MRNNRTGGPAIHVKHPCVRLALACLVCAICLYCALIVAGLVHDVVMARRCGIEDVREYDPEMGEVIVHYAELYALSPS